jgi:hypothetical protein
MTTKLSEQPQEWTPRKAAIQCWNIRNKSDAKQQFEKIITAALAAAKQELESERENAIKAERYAVKLEHQLAKVKEGK